MGDKNYDDDHDDKTIKKKEERNKTFSCHAEHSLIIPLTNVHLLVFTNATANQYRGHW